MSDVQVVSNRLIRSKWNWILRLHFVAFLLHMGASIVTAILTKDEATIPITTYFPDSEFKPAQQFVNNTPPGYLTIGYSLPSAIEHMISFLLLLADRQTHYKQFLMNNADIVRWISYSISAPIMMVQIAMRCGIFDPVLLSAIALLYLSMMTFGMITEHILIQDKGKRLSFVNLPMYCGWIPFVGSWAIIFVYFFRATNDGTKPPAFVYAIVIGEFFIMCLFGAVLMYAVHKRKKLQSKMDYIGHFLIMRIITLYIFLSLTAKLFLAALNWYGSQTL